MITAACLTQVQAMDLINKQMQRFDLTPVSQTNFYRLRAIYMRLFPKSRWIVGDRLVYAPPVVLFLYFLCRLHSMTQSLRLTEMGARDTVSKLPARFSECFRSFSDIDNLFLNHAPTAA